MELHFEIEPKRGRLHVQLGQVEAPDGKEAISLTLTARGPLGEGLPLDAGLDLGRETIVTAFKALTTNEAHKYWGERHVVSSD